MIIASFAGLKFENIEGYRISCRLTPGKGFDGHFYVYIEERRQATTPFEEAVKVSEKKSDSIVPKRGTLSISDEDRSYEFKDIDLSFAELGATRRERTRYFEFRYNPMVTDGKSAAPITIDGKKKEPLGPSGLGADYKGGIESRHLLGFRAYVSGNDGTLVRFANLGCMPKSFLEKVVQVNKDMQSGDKVLPDFTVNFSQGDFAVTRHNLVAFYVEESWGALTLQRTPPLFRLLETGVPAAERLRPQDHLPNDLLWHNISREFKAMDIQPGTVEVSTLVFKQGYFHELSVR